MDKTAAIVISYFPCMHGWLHAYLHTSTDVRYNLNYPSKHYGQQDAKSSCTLINFAAITHSSKHIPVNVYIHVYTFIQSGHYF